MENFIDELKTEKVLSKDDVIKLKQYISKKYEHYTPSEKLNVLTKSVHQVLDRNMKGINENYADTIKKNILKNTLLKDGKTIFLIDIFNNCLSVETENEDYSESILNWVNSHVKNEVSSTELEKFNLRFKDIEVPMDKATVSIPVEVKTEPEMPKEYNKQLTLEKLKCFLKQNSYKCAFCVILVLGLITQHGYISDKFFSSTKTSASKISQSLNKAKSNETFIASSKSFQSNLPSYFKYKKIKLKKLKKYLSSRDSLLATEPYFSTMLKVSKEYNLNPLVLFAITGQEQSFVPANTPNAKKIANNPFNVYHSWQEYNTNLQDAAEIASRTVINLCKDRPNDKEAFHWINRKYAEDKKWGDGVEKIYEALENNDK